MAIERISSTYSGIEAIGGVTASEDRTRGCISSINKKPPSAAHIVAEIATTT